MKEREGVRGREGDVERLPVVQNRALALIGGIP
jgi:hypothetical protein